MSDSYEKKITIERMRKSTIQRKFKIDEFYSDRSRIIYSSSFRRLQQKAQVFSLESNASVRTRMTHTLEVSDIGRTLSNAIAQNLYDKNFLNSNCIPEFVSIVENACLLHDIGNPPFGHFGEAAIQDWSKKVLLDLPDDNIRKNRNFQTLMQDFYEFDGNPQGFRIVTKLHTETDENSLNLTYSTLLCMLKYARSPGEKSGKGILKKAGFFLSENEVVQQIWQAADVKPKHRYPLTYIMEAADDIAYCLSDISDGIEKRLMHPNTFIEEFNLRWGKQCEGKECPVPIPEKIHNFNRDISIPWSKVAIQEATQNYIENHKSFYEGTADELIPKASMGKVFDIVKQISREYLYSSIEAESIELTGYAVITGILKHYQALLEINYESFNLLMERQTAKGLDFEKRLLNRIGKRYIKAYQYAIEKIEKNEDFYTYEFWLRVHLLIDHISGMTDGFALNTYQMLEGINLLKL